MTGEEAKKYIGELKMYANSQGWDEEYQIACDATMNKLEQEPILDKIRAEIERKFNTHGTVNLYNKAINDVLEIIDKYKADSEGKE